MISPCSRFLLRRCLGAVLLLVACSALSAEVIFDVFVGYGLGVSDGVVAEGGWFPVTCEVQNNGPGFNGTVEVTSVHGARRVVRLELPTGTKKRFVVPLYCGNKSRLAVDAVLRTEKGRLVAEQRNLEPHVQVDSLSTLLAIMPRKHGAVIFPEPAKSMPQYAPAVAHLNADTFPEQPIALEGIGTLYLHSSHAAELKVPQVTALLAWLHAGGRLVVGVEQPGDVTGADWLQAILPCTLGAVVTNTGHRALQQWLNRPFDDTEEPAKRPLVHVYTKLAPDSAFEDAPLPLTIGKLRDGEVLAGSAQEPLMISAPRGRGELVVLLFSPELAPFNAWINRYSFWARLAHVPSWWLASANPPAFSNTPLDGAFGSMVDSRQIKKLPIGWLLLLLVIYLVVIGPLDQFWLKKINRQMLTWITFPTYVVIFSGLIYFIGYTLRSGESEWNELQVVDVVPHGARADLRGRTYGSAYSPLNASYPLASDQPFATLRGEVSAAGEQAERADVVELRGNSFNARMSVPVWTSQLYVNDWWRQDSAPLEFEASSRGAVWQLVIKRVAYPNITRAKFIVGDQVYMISEPRGLAAGKSYAFSRGSGQTLFQFVQAQQSLLHNAVSQRQRQFGSQHGGHIEEGNILDCTAAASFLSVLGENSENAPNQPYGYAGRFIQPRGFDLAADLHRDFAVLVVHLPGQTLAAPLNQFSPRMSRKSSVLRVIAPVQH